MHTQKFDAVVSAPFGAVGIVTQDDYVIAMTLLATKQSEYVSDHPFVQSVVRQVRQYLNNSNTQLDIPVAIKGTAFQKRVWNAIASIPVGKTISYTTLAEMVGSGPRAVANACGANQVPLVIPCHRVIAKQGLGGFMQGEADGLVIKSWLLQHEQNH
ncbi:MAG: methylated-DNA--[protein]-cysteine S-methyltransferase [Methylophilaceae bacterium]|nr:methylated-DNA--[protein]-cysteine S-methyltransferase [Methylophilaceae bacterium]